jgi:hypothetical protein
MTKQEKILRELCDKHDLTLTEGGLIWGSFCGLIEETISADKKTDGLFDKNKFKVIHVDMFGKFKPNMFGISKANGNIKKREDGRRQKNGDIQD